MTSLVLFWITRAEAMTEIHLNMAGILVVLVLCTTNVPNAHAGGAIIALAQPLAQAMFGGLKAVAKSGIVQKTISYGSAGAMAGGGDALGDYISATIQASNNIALAKLQHQYMDQVRNGGPLQPSVQKTETGASNSATGHAQGLLRHVLSELLNGTLAKTTSAIVTTPSRAEATVQQVPIETILSQATREVDAKIIIMFYAIAGISILMLFVVSAGCICMYKLFCEGKIQKDMKVKFYNDV